MRIRDYSFSIATALFVLAAVLSASVATAAGLASSRTEAAALLIGPAQAQEAKPAGIESSSLEDFDINQFLKRYPGTPLAGLALPFILMLRILARRRHYLWLSILIGAIAGAACETIPDIERLIVSPMVARLVQSTTAALIALVLALFFDLMLLLGQLSHRLIPGKSLGDHDPVREWFREAILVQRWAPPRDRAQEVDDAVVRWHIALVTGAGALVAAVLTQGHFVAGVREHFSAAGFLTTTVILIAALYIFEPVRERILRLAGPGRHEDAARDSLVRTVIDSPRRGWVLSVSIVFGALVVQAVIIGLEEAIHKAAPTDLLELAFSGLGAIPIAYFLCAALQKGLELTRATRGTTAFFALLFLPFLLTAGLIAGGMTYLFVVTFGLKFASFTIASLVGIAVAFIAGAILTLIAFAIVFWLSLGVALVGGFIFGGLTVWVMHVIWPRTRRARPFVYLALAIVIATVLESLVISPLYVLSPLYEWQQLFTDTLTMPIGWLIGLWLSGIAGVLETYQDMRPELFPNLKMAPPQGSTFDTEI
jgi:hypothetical protein